VLRKQRAQQAADRLAAGERWRTRALCSPPRLGPSWIPPTSDATSGGL
jgi:hypothetical protein